MGYNEEGIGYQQTDTSRQGADFNKQGKLSIRKQIKDLFVNADKVMLTVEEISKSVFKPEISVKPRVTELKNEGILQDSGYRRMGKWGTNIIVWELNKGE
jgi:hypothetical protein|tara:strand:- start:592 stop:891 length:300 start_codon:yes stop_codon:yes gene_type:complete